MKNLHKLIVLLIFWVGISLSCEKENQPPTCSITNPKNNIFINFGTKVTVSVIATDEDGTINEVSCYLGNNLIGSKQNPPFNFEIKDNTQPGEYVIKVIVIDDKGDSSEATHKINIEAMTPIVQILETLYVGTDSIKIKANVSADGGADITQRGFCWNTTGNPTINDEKKEVGSGLGEFIGSLIHLKEGQKYYVNAFATNSKGTSYGTVKEITTNIVKPKVKTRTVDNIDSKSAIVHGEVTSSGGSEISDRGVCYGLNSNPTLANSYVSGGVGLGTYEVELIDLAPFTKYYVRAYAVNEIGTSYGNENSFTTSKGSPLVGAVEVSNIQAYSVDLIGEILANGGATITRNGFCYNKTGSPTINDNPKDCQVGEPMFGCNINNLTPGTKYFIRAFAENSIGISYGEVKEFTTNSVKPTIETRTVDNIDSKSVIVHGEVTSSGGSEISDRGVCYGLNSNPTLANSYVSGGVGLGTYEVELIDLTPFTKYYVKAYAVNEMGTSYGGEHSFSTLKGNPSVATLDVSNIGSYSVDSKGEILANGGATITRNGFCYNKTGSPTINDNPKNCQVGEPMFGCNINNLTPGTKYFIRAFAENSVGISYGEVKEFTTEAILPEVETKNAYDVSIYSAKANGNIGFNGGASIIQRGICWNKTGNPDINDNKTDNGSGEGSFTAIMTGLSPETRFYYRAYAKNSVGVGYGEEKGFTTLPLPQPKWLYYDDGEPELAIPNPNSTGSSIFYVRFRKPQEWSACKITKIKIGYVMTMPFSSGFFDIVLFKNTQTIEGYRFPLGNYQYLKKSVDETTSVGGNWKTFDVNNEIFSDYFYVGVKLQNTAGTKIMGDRINETIDNNSGLYLSDNQVTMINDLKWYIQAYVEYKQESSEKSGWIDVENNTTDFPFSITVKELLDGDVNFAK